MSVLMMMLKQQARILLDDLVSIFIRVKAVCEDRARVGGVLSRNKIYLTVRSRKGRSERTGITDSGLMNIRMSNEL